MIKLKGKPKAGVIFTNDNEYWESITEYKRRKQLLFAPDWVHNYISLQCINNKYSLLAPVSLVIKYGGRPDWETNRYLDLKSALIDASIIAKKHNLHIVYINTKKPDITI